MRQVDSIFQLLIIFFMNKNDVSFLPHLRKTFITQFLSTICSGLDNELAHNFNIQIDISS